jgi:hypothetical protein
MSYSAEWIKETINRISELEELVGLYVDQRRQVDPKFPSAYLALDDGPAGDTLRLLYYDHGEDETVYVKIDDVANMNMESARKEKELREAKELKIRQEAKERDLKYQKERELAQLDMLLKKYGNPGSA